MRDFRKLDIWIDSMEVVKNVYIFLSKFPKKEVYGLVSQMSRSAVSIPSNIAEGSSRNSQKDYKRFLEIAIGSAFELETQLLLSIELGLGKKEKAQEILKELEIIQKRINTLITIIKKDIQRRSKT